ncbi:transcription elongation factor S-II [Xylaria sp. CBS 124048]|nr:transcription elongation factor S-II [Xylaria sp. CBS 124048]
MPGPTRAELLAAAKAFCDSFARKESVEEILSHFSSSSTASDTKAGAEQRGNNHGDDEILVHEHGLPQLAPFLGRDFRGVEGAREYFETVGARLHYEDMRFVEFIVDDNVSSSASAVGNGGGGKVVARGQARFTWRETAQSWEETFVYVLLLDAWAKVRRYEVWADSGAAYLARRGELGSD